MLKNYLTIALRNLVRYKIYTAINALGLVTGIAFCLLTFLYVRHEWTYDQFHEKSDRIFRLSMSGGMFGGKDNTRHVWLSEKIGPLMRENIPQFAHVVRIRQGPGTVSHGNNTFEVKSLFTDEDFFQLFTFPLIHGDPKTVLANPNSIVLTQSAAKKYFGQNNVVGQEISIQHRIWEEEEKTFVVAGIAEDTPENSSIQFDLILSYASIPPSKRSTVRMSVSLSQDGKTERKEIIPPVFSKGNDVTYIQLIDKVQLADLAPVLNAFVEANKTPNPLIRGNSKRRFLDPGVNLHLQPIADIHFDREITNGLSAPSNPAYSYILAGIALSVLLVACINFTNLTIARSATRAREVGVRKVVGAMRFQLMKQFWGESLLLTGVGMLLGLALTEFFLSTFNTLTQVNLTLDYRPSLSGVFFGLSLLLIISLVSGIYPALVLSGFDPIAVLKNRFNIGGRSWSGRVLIVGQFVVAILFLIATLVMSRQLTFLKEKNLGLNESQVVLINPRYSSPDRQERHRILQLFKRELKRHPQIVSVTQSSLFSHLEADSDTRKSNITFPNGEIVEKAEISVDYDFFDTLGINLLAGRNFSPDFGADATQAVLVNKTFVERAQLEQPLNTTLPMTKMTISFTPGDFKSGSSIPIPKPIRIKDPKIIGVVDDFHLRSLYHTLPPLVIFLDAFSLSSDFLVRIRPERMSETITFMAEKWQSIAGDAPFDYVFLDENFDRLYREEERWGTIVQYASFFALFVACLGVLGLTSLAITRRTKEIGIRKVLGASNHHIVALLSREFVVLILIANLIAWPIAHYGVEHWLRDFAYRIDAGMGLFLLGGLLVFLTALLTIGIQALKAAQRNPVHALRYE
ncbi:MAG: FtsX-like permease family protein [Gemmatimonadetes bacterium]|nr:FtsX-like permease family protein [Gemmatimonadota bacterium]